MNEWMMHLYSTLLCIAVHPKRFTIMGGGDYWEAMIDKGQWREFGQDTGVTPLLFTMSVMRYLMTTESQDLCMYHCTLIDTIYLLTLSIS